MLARRFTSLAFQERSIITLHRLSSLPLRPISSSSARHMSERKSPTPQQETAAPSSSSPAASRRSVGSRAEADDVKERKKQRTSPPAVEPNIWTAARAASAAAAHTRAATSSAAAVTAPAASTTAAASAPSPVTASASSAAASSSPAAPFRLVEKKGDLFGCPPDVSLAHCVSECLAMGKGVAVAFKSKFAGVDELKAQKRGIGQVAVLQRGKRWVYYLITKARYFHKPTYASLEDSLHAMRNHMQGHGVTRLAIPRIGCGLDGLEWGKVKLTLERVFKDSGIEITVYTL